MGYHAMKLLRHIVFAFAVLAASPVAAQWQTSNHSVPVGRGGGVSGFGSVGPCNSGIAIVGQGALLDPQCGSVDLSVGVTGNLAPSRLNSGIGANSATFWAGDGTWKQPPSGLYVQPKDFGAVCDGVADDHTALQNMINASAGKAIFLPAGTCRNISAPLILPTFTTITGAGNQVAILQCGVNPCIGATNKSHISLTNFWCQGTDSAVSWAASPVGCFSFVQDGSAVTTGLDIVLRGLRFSGHNATYWNEMSLAGSSLFFSGFVFEDNILTSTGADIPTDANPLNNSNFGLVMYSGSGGGGRYENTVIRNNFVDANALCFGLVQFGNHYKPQVTGNLILRPGQTSSAHCNNGTGTNAYGILIYDLIGDGNPPTNFLVDHNTIIQPLRTGIYLVGDGDPAHTAAVYNSSRSIVTNNLCDGQTANDNLLPRGCVGIGNLTDIEVSGNGAYGGAVGFSTSGQITGVINFVGNTCRSPAASALVTNSCFELKASPLNTAAVTAQIVLKNNYAEMQDTTTNGGAAINMVSTTGARFGTVTMEGNTIRAGNVGLNGGGQFFVGNWNISGDTYGGVASALMASVASLTGNGVTLNNLIFDSSEGVSGFGLVADSSVVNANGIQFKNRASGTVPMWHAASACGTLQGIQFNRVVQPAQVFAGSLGTANPSGCTLNYQDFVQDLQPVAGAGAIWGWWHTSTTTSTTHQAMAFP